MKLEVKSGLAGFSFGIGIVTKRFTFNYGLGVNSLAGSAHHLGFSTSINSLLFSSISTCIFFKEATDS